MNSGEKLCIWQSADWPNWRYDLAALTGPLAEVSRAQGMLLGRLANVGMALRDQASLAALTEDVVKTSEIEGEVLNVESVRSSIARRLTTQVPTREVFLTSGRSRKLQLGNRTVELKHGKRWQLTLGKRPAGRAIRALFWLGPEQASSALKMLHTKLPPAEWAAMRSARAVLPSWMARAVSEASEHA